MKDSIFANRILAIVAGFTLFSGTGAIVLSFDTTPTPEQLHLTRTFDKTWQDGFLILCGIMIRKKKGE